MAKKIKKSDFITTGTVAENHRARFDYNINETFIAGMVLLGTEVKSLLFGHANIRDAYGVIAVNGFLRIIAFIKPHRLTFV